MEKTNSQCSRPAADFKIYDSANDDSLQAAHSKQSMLFLPFDSGVGSHHRVSSAMKTVSVSEVGCMIQQCGESEARTRLWYTD